MEWQYEIGLETEYIGVDHVPYILVNGAFSQNNEQYVLTNLLGTICRLYNGSNTKDYCSQYQ
jgi:hypothetical protein